MPRAGSPNCATTRHREDYPFLSLKYLWGTCRVFFQGGGLPHCKARCFTMPGFAIPGGLRDVRLRVAGGLAED